MVKSPLLTIMVATGIIQMVAGASHIVDSPPQDCIVSPRSIVNDACASYATLEDLNRRVKPALDDLVTSTDFFSHYRLNLYHKQCPFWNDESGTCGNRACAVETLDDEKDIPEVWRAKELGKLQGPVAKHPGKKQQKERPLKKPLLGGLGENIGESCVVEYDDECDERDYCVPEDESATSKGDYVSLIQNPERFTGYAGAGARQVWDTIYSENCFQKSSFPQSANLGQMSSQGLAAHDFKQVLQAVSRQQVFESGFSEPAVKNSGATAATFGDEECLEKRVFYRVVSGMHASINTHLCWDYFNQTTGEWTRNIDCYVNRLHKFPDRISNLYFNYALVSRAIAKLGPYLQTDDYTFCLGDPDGDKETRNKVLAVTEGAASVPHLFDESLMFKNGEGPSLKEDFRNRFRNVSRVMDCVGCDKCRLWGKLQTAGYGTALKVLFEFENDNEIPILSRTEIVALFNTYARVSNSMMAIHEFREMLLGPVDTSIAVETPLASSTPDSSSGFVADEVDADALSMMFQSEQHPAPTESVDPSGTTQRAEYWEEVKYAPVETGAASADPSTLSKAAVRKKPLTPQEERKRPQHKMERALHMPDMSKRRQNDPNRGAMDEVRLVWEILKYIVGSWMQVPKAVIVVVFSELVRAWQFFIGVPVAPRGWAYGSHEEL